MPQRVGNRPQAAPVAAPRSAGAAPPRAPPQRQAAPATQGWQPKPAARRPSAQEDFPSAPREFPKSADGTPIFKQGDAEWGRRTLGNDSTITRSGCAMTSSAMAMSKIRGEVLTPKDLDAWLDKNRGYSGDALDWSRVGKSKNLLAENQRWSLANLDASLAQGRPAVIGVDYKEGSNGGPNGTDHWICVTAKQVGADGKVTYSANDPGTGKEITLTPDKKGRLVGDGANALGKYVSSGQLRVFVDA